MKKIYILSEGSYSDFHIVGVAEDKETAEMLSEKWGCDYNEYKLNSLEDAKLIQNKTLYEVTMWKNGNSEVKKDDYQDRDANEPDFYFWGGMDAGVEVIVEIECWADSPEHAVKIANEKRAYLIATGEWGLEESRLKKVQNEHIELQRKRYKTRIVHLNADESCSHRSLLASKPILNEAFYYQGNELYKIYRCQFCYEIVREEKVDEFRQFS